MSNSFAQSIFQGASTDKLPVADVYNAPAIDLLSSSVTGVKKVLGNVFTSIRSKGFDLNTLAGMVDINSGAVSLDANAAKSRLNSLLGVNITSIKDLSAAAQLNAVNRLTQLAGIGVPTITDAAGNVIKVYNNANGKDVNGVLSGIKAVLGDIGLSSVVDDTAKMAFLGSMMDYATQWGLVDTVQTIMNKFEVGSTERDYMELVLTQNFSAACVTGDLDNLQTIIDNTGPMKIIAQYPNAVSMVLTGFQFQSGVNPGAYPDLLVKFLRVLSSLDVNWDTVIRNNTAVSKLEPFLTASNDSKTLFSYNDDYWDLCLMANSYQTQDALAVVKTMYPGIAI
jgi:hypothetical protein